MSRLILVRHGQTRSNVQGLLDTAAPGPGLTELGRRQAAALVDVLAAERIDRIVASPLRRTLETAAPLAEDRALPVLQDAGLREILAGDLEMRSDSAAHMAYLGTVLAWAGGDAEAEMPGRPETGSAFLRRYDAAVEAALDGVDVAVCVSHGAAIRAWSVARAVNVDAAFGGEHGLPNTGVVVLDRTAGGRWRVEAWLGRPVPQEERDPAAARMP